MKVKRLISAALSGIMLLSSGGIIPVSAEETNPNTAGITAVYGGHKAV